MSSQAGINFKEQLQQQQLQRQRILNQQWVRRTAGRAASGETTTVADLQGWALFGWLRALAELVLRSGAEQQTAHRSDFSCFPSLTAQCAIVSAACLSWYSLQRESDVSWYPRFRNELAQVVARRPPMQRPLTPPRPQQTDAPQQQAASGSSSSSSSSVSRPIEIPSIMC